MAKKKEKKLRRTSSCLNCHHPIENHNYCPNCGQQNVDKQASLSDFLHDALGDILTFDHKFFRSFKPLLFKPGFLTKEYNQGKRVNYILPLRLYIFVSLVFFFIYTISDPMESIFLDEPEQTIPMDSITNHFLHIENVDSVEVYKMNLTVNKIYNKIRINDEGRVWDHFLRNDVTVSDSIRNSHAFWFQFYLKLKPKENPRNGINDSIQFYNVVGDPKFNLTKDQVDYYYQNIKNKYRINRVYYSGKSKTAFTKTIRKVIPDTNKADYERRELLINYDFIKEQNKVQTGLTEVDSTKYPMIYNFGKRIEEQGRKVNETENSGKIIYLEVFNQLPKVIFVLLPIFALIMKIFYIRKKVYYVNHLIFALHAHSILFIYLILGVIVNNLWVYLALIPGIWFHLFMSLRYVYGQSKFMTFLKLNSIFLIYFFFVVFGIIAAIIISFFKV